MKEIPLTKGKVAIVDDEDYEWLSQYKWYVHTGGYAARHTVQRDVGKQKRKNLYMHRIVLGVNGKEHCDHKNGNKLDNRKCNLRQATNSQNMWNSCKQKQNTSGYKGVFKHRDSWAARTSFHNKPIHIGTYSTKEEAARAYDEKAKELFGEFARLNFEGEQNG